MTAVGFLRLRSTTDAMIIGFRSAFGGGNELCRLDSDDEIRRRLIEAFVDNTALEQLRRFWAIWESDSFRIDAMDDRLLIDRIAIAIQRGQLAMYLVPDSSVKHVFGPANAKAAGGGEEGGAGRTGLNEQKLKQNAISVWRQGGENSPVKVLGHGTEPDSHRPIGYCTTLKYVAGRTPEEIERIVGLRSGTKLGSGADIYLVQPLPSPGQFALRGYTQTPEGKSTDEKAPHADYPPGQGVPQWELIGLTQQNLKLLGTVLPGQRFAVKYPPPGRQSSRSTSSLHGGLSVQSGEWQPIPTEMFDMQRRLTYVMRRVPPLLALDTRSDSSKLTEPAVLDVVAETLTVWARAHSYGTGLIVDSLVVSAGLVEDSWAIMEAAKRLNEGILKTGDAQTLQELDEAAKAFARAITLVGASAFLAAVRRGVDRVQSPPRKQPKRRAPPEVRVVEPRIQPRPEKGPAEVVAGTPVAVDSGANTIVCRAGNLVVQNKNNGPDRACTEAHEGSHIADWKGRYGENLCVGVPDGQLPLGGPDYSEFLRESECKAYKVGKACRERLLQTAAEADKPAIRDAIARDDAQLVANRCR